MSSRRSCLSILTGLAMPALAALGGCVTNTNTSASVAAAPSVTRPAAAPAHMLVLVHRSAPVFAVASGKRTRLATAHSLNIDCSLNDTMTIRIVVAPAHGTATTGAGRFYPTYPRNNVHAPCNARPAEGMAAWYRSEPGYVGPDFVEMEIIAPDGRSERVDYHLDVK